MEPLTTLTTLFRVLADTGAPLSKALLLYLKVINLAFTVLIALVAVVLALRAPRESSSETRRILFALAVGGFLWSLSYSLDLFIIVRDLRTSDFVTQVDLRRLAAPVSKQARNLFEQLNSVLNLLVTTAFVVAGSALLRLDKRIHANLLPPSTDGLSLSFASPLGTPRASWLFFVLGLVLIGLYWTDAKCAPSVDAFLSFLSILILGLGFLRELNRNRLDLTGGIPAGLVLLYAVSQIGVLFSPLVIVTYTLSIVFKFAMLMGFAGFVGAGQAAGHALRTVQMDFSNQQAKVLQNHLVARHSIRNATSAQGLIIAKLAQSIPAALHPLLEALQEQGEIVEKQAEQLSSLDEGKFMLKYSSVTSLLQRAATDLDRLYGASVRVKTIADSEVQVPFDLLRNALDRIIENAARAGAPLVTLSASRDGPCWIISIENNGPPISPDMQRDLFRTREGGFWAARRIAVNLGGDVKLAHTSGQTTCFNVLIPDARRD